MSQPSSGQTPVSALVVAVGIAGLIFGTLIATLSDGGRTPGLVIVGIGAVLTVPGILLVRRDKRRLMYRVTKRWSTGLLLAAVGAGIVVVAGSFLIVIGLDKLLGVRIPAFWLFVPGGLLVLRYYWAMRTAFLVNARGVQHAGVPMPWATVDQIVITRDGAVSTIDVHRRPDAPALEHPAVPVEIPARKVVPADLAAAVRRFGPADVEVLERPGTAEQRPLP